MELLHALLDRRRPIPTCLTTIQNFQVGKIYDEQSPADLIKGGHMPLIERLTEADLKRADWMVGAAMYGRLEIIKYLEKRFRLQCRRGVMDEAIMNGHLDVVKYLHDQRCYFLWTSFGVAAYNGHLDVVQFGRFQVGWRPTSATITGVCLRGHVDVVEFLHSVGTERAQLMGFYAAVVKGHVDVVKHLVSLGLYEENYPSFQDAARYGQLEMVKLAHEIGVSFKELTFNDLEEHFGWYSWGFVCCNDPINCNHGKLPAVSEDRYLEIITYMLENNMLSPRFSIPDTIRRAEGVGFTRVVELLQSRQ